MIGPDHILFLVGLLLLGGTWMTLLRIVTAFTIGHSITLSLAALNIVTPPATIIEPAIALSIVFVGADNLVRGDGRDLRAWVALVFGLVHGFGFANVLREFGLPREALGWSLFSFNFGVEIGQVAIVLVVASLLAAVAPAQRPDGCARGRGGIRRRDCRGHLLVRGAGVLPGRPGLRRALLAAALVALAAAGARGRRSSRSSSSRSDRSRRSATTSS